MQQRVLSKNTLRDCRPRKRCNESTATRLTYGAMIALQPLIGGENPSSGEGFTKDKKFESSE